MDIIQDVLLSVLRSLELPTRHTQDDPFRAFVEVIVSGDDETAIRLLKASPNLANERAARGAIRQAARENFFDRIRHYIYEGDTALHMAAAANQTDKPKSASSGTTRRSLRIP